MSIAPKELLRRPILLEPAVREMSWGSEVWLNGTQAEAPALVHGEERLTLSDLLQQHPEALGIWSRMLFGDELPIFTKFLRTRFPPFVHAGFSRQVDRASFLAMLHREQACLRALHEALNVPDERAFGEFQKSYEAWAVGEALVRWRSDDDRREEAFVASLRPMLRGDAVFDLSAWRKELSENRASIVEALNEIDLEKEDGNLLLMSAGLPHAIFGLSHQTHPLDRSRRALEALYGQLRLQALERAPEEAMAETVREADLPALRARNSGAPKNEAWIPVRVDGGILLVEPQQTSNVTYSFADFYTPFTWKGRLAFRKGDPARGLSNEDLEAFTRELDFAATPVEELRRRPSRAGTGEGAAGSESFLLVDEPEVWPFFTVREVRLRGTAGMEARWSGGRVRGAFQQLVIIDGEARIEGAWGETEPLSRMRPAFLPATLDGAYALTARCAARVLVFSVPVP